MRRGLLMPKKGNAMLTTFAVYASIVTGAIWIALLAWLAFRLTQAAKETGKELPPEQRNYD